MPERGSVLPWRRPRTAEDRRVLAPLLWPSVPRPEPIAVLEDGVYRGSELEGRYWSVRESYTGLQVECHYLRGGKVYLKDPHGQTEENTIFLADRLIYLTKADALAAAWWRRAEIAAQELRTLQAQYQEELARS